MNNLTGTMNQQLCFIIPYSVFIIAHQPVFLNPDEMPLMVAARA